MNAICTEQNRDLQIKRLAAQRSLYSSAKTVFAVNATLSVIVPLTLSFAISHLGLQSCLSATLIGINVCFLTPCQRKLQKRAATIQESFDCDVLGLPWQPLVVGKAIDLEIVLKQASRYKRRVGSFDSLRDWYPSPVCRIPLPLARIVCQRLNAWWDANQRKRHGAYLSTGVTLLVLLPLTIGLLLNIRLLDLLLLFAPIAPAIVFLLQHQKETRASVTRLEKLKDHAQDLWNRALRGESDQYLKAASRTLQNELYDHRHRDIPVFDWIYRHLQPEHEIQAQETAALMVAEFEATRNHEVANR